MGGAKEVVGSTGQASRSGAAREAEDVGGGVEGPQGSHEEALGGVPESQERWGVGPQAIDLRNEQVQVGRSSGRSRW